MSWCDLRSLKFFKKTSSLTQYTKAKYLQTVIQHSESHRVDVISIDMHVCPNFQSVICQLRWSTFQPDFYRACKLWEIINSMTSKRMCTDKFQKGMNLQKRSHEISDIESQVQETFRWTTNWIEISVSDVFVTNLLINIHCSFLDLYEVIWSCFQKFRFWGSFSSLRSDMFHIKRIFFPNSWVTLRHT